MPSLRERLVDVVLGPEKRKLEQGMRILAEAYQDGPWQLPPQELARQLAETDSAVIADLVAQLGYDYFGSLQGYLSNVEAERQRAVDESRRLWRYSPLAQWSVNVWTNFGLGEAVAVSCDDPDADETWKECWKAERNALLFGDDKIQNLSNDLLVDGNLFFAAYVSTLDGKVTWTTIAPEEIAEIVTAKGNAQRPLFYKRVWTEGTDHKTMYYPDWQAYFDESKPLENKDLVELPNGAIRADQVNDTDQRKTTVCILHVAHNIKTRGSLWGFPILAIAAPYMRTHKRYMEDRLTVADTVQMYVHKVKVQGGSRAVASARTKLQSTLSSTNATETNPRAPAGSTWVENQAADMSKLPLASGAGDAKADNEMFTWMALIGAGLFPTSAGLDTSRWATALAMDKTQAMQWSRYQTFWSAQFKTMVKVTLNFSEKYGGMSYETKDAQVSIDSFSLVDFQPVVEAMSSLISSGLTPLITANVIPQAGAAKIMQQLWRIALKSLGVTDEATTSDATFGIIPDVPEQVTQVLKKAVEKYHNGELTPNEFAEFMLAEWLDEG